VPGFVTLAGERRGVNLDLGQYRFSTCYPWRVARSALKIGGWSPTDAGRL
jgi:hypothetical protein